MFGHHPMWVFWMGPASFAFSFLENRTTLDNGKPNIVLWSSRHLWRKSIMPSISTLSSSNVFFRIDHIPFHTVIFLNWAYRTIILLLTMFLTKQRFFLPSWWWKFWYSAWAAYASTRSQWSSQPVRSSIQLWRWFSKETWWSSSTSQASSSVGWNTMELTTRRRCHRTSWRRPIIYLGS